MKNSSNNVFLDFPSLSSLTITSKNDPGFLKEHPHSYSSTTIVTSSINDSIIEQQKQQQQQKKNKSYNSQYFDYHNNKKSEVHASTARNKKKRLNWSIIQQFKIFLANNIKLSPTATTDNQQQQPYQQQQRHHRHYRHPRLLSHYGELQRRQIGTGASATVRLTHQIEDGGKLRIYAVKAFRKRKARETDASFMKKLISEFCISSALDHPNIVKTVDLVVDEKNRYCTVMEYVSIYMHKHFLIRKIYQIYTYSNPLLSPLFL
jgi:hypothetical protein